MTRLRAFSGALVLLALLQTGAVVGAGPAEFDLHLRVAYAEDIGRERLRSELELATFERLQESGCFRSVRLATERAEPAESDLLLELILREVIDETEYAMSLAQRSDPRIPDQDKREVARLEVAYTLRLSTWSDGHLLRQRRPRSEEAYRPLSVEDARYEVELRSVKAISRAARELACRGSAKKLARQVATQRREAAATR